MPPPTNLFTTDDYSVIDISGKAYNSQFFSFQGSFLQYLTGSQGSITVALGSGGSGPPKEIILSPGGKVELQDKSRPFSGFFLTCAANDNAKILVANSGVEITPSPGRITQIGEVERITEPISLTTPVGNAGLVIPIDPASLTNGDGEFVAGRAIALQIEKTPGDTVNFVNLIAHNTRTQLTTFAPPGPIAYTVPLGTAGQTADKLYPCVAGDILFISRLTVMITPWQTFSGNGNSRQFNFNADMTPTGSAARIYDSSHEIFLEEGEIPNVKGNLFGKNNRSAAYSEPPNRTGKLLELTNTTFILQGTTVSLEITIPWKALGVTKPRR